jgi:hypothetical protein
VTSRHPGGPASALAAGYAAALGAGGVLLAVAALTAFLLVPRGQPGTARPVPAAREDVPAEAG